MIMGLGDGLPMEPPMARIMGQINLPPLPASRSQIHSRQKCSQERFSCNSPGYIYKPSLLEKCTTPINSRALLESSLPSAAGSQSTLGSNKVQFNATT